jgi:hypothetical protein
LAVEIMFTIYGDESTSGKTTVYGALFVPSSQIGRAEQILRQTKQEYGVPEGAELHCYVLFHGDHRKKSKWSHLGEEQTYAFAEQLLSRFRALPCIFSVGAIHRSEYPQALLAGAGFPAGQFETKQLTALAFQAATIPLVQNFDRATVCLYVDPDPGKIRWFGKKIKADSNYRIAAGGGVGDVEIVPQQVTDPLPTLLEVADLFAYASGRALSPDSCRAKDRYEAMYRICRPLLSVMTYDPEKRMRNKVPDSILEARHAAIRGTEGGGKSFSQMPPGACIWMVGVNRGGDAYPCLMLRLPTGMAEPLLKAPCGVDIRYGEFVVGEYSLIPCLVRLPNNSLTFTTFLNQFAHQPDSPILQLAKGAGLRLLLFEDGDKPVGELPFPSVRPQFWAKIDRMLAVLPPYQDDVHEAALTAFKLSPDEMWDAL